ncbi:MAG: toll/interleukin-1 receptor domain-containing protein [Fibrobacter sp.]|nr:toll/interleukin-1 receptor domain-containing protein [Fibrobacter sp.]MBR6122449.1 toll/interleukin-1 receptor domain-containing protein [Candidatus Saccharibacteria bacterium]MBR6125687.1 toll/interleukin-1 receptor domain-containing protein [Candidatus Saccharibacteria bacterium]
MSSFFYRGQFDRYRVSDLKPALENVVEAYSFPRDASFEFLKQTTVFLSHKHDDLNDLKGVIGMLERKFNVKVYIDSRDEKMPKVTSGETATRIKKKINDCDKFILLATDDAIESKWCNWELGYGDSLKNENGNLALFPMTENRFASYKGNEYLEIYPHIISKYEYTLPKYSIGEEKYYVQYKGVLTPLDQWFSK